MKYYKLLYDDKHVKDAIVCMYEELYGIGHYDMIEGMSIKGFSEQIGFSYNPKEGSIVTDYMANNLDWFIISSRFKCLFDSFGIEGMEYFPINISNTLDKTSLDGYYIANICNVIEGALELEKSKFVELKISERKALIVIKPVLKEKYVEGQHIFKLREDCHRIYISERIKKAIKEEGIKGCDFVNVEVI